MPYTCEWCGRVENNPYEDIKEVWARGALSCCYYRAMINDETGEQYGREGQKRKPDKGNNRF